MELGGHAPVLVFDDTDPVATGLACARAKFRNAGEVCISATRFYAQSAIYEPFRESDGDLCVWPQARALA